MSKMAAVGMDIESHNFIFMFSLRVARQEIVPGHTFKKKELHYYTDFRKTMVRIL